MKKLLFYALTVSVILLTACGAPKGFVKSNTGSEWSSILIRDGLEYDKAFNEVLDVVAKKYEMDIISKDGGYAKTNWIYTWNPKNKYNKKYKTRITFKFSPDRSKVDVKAEAEYGKEHKSKKGFDSRLLQSIKQDVMGVVGRTTM